MDRSCDDKPCVDARATEELWSAERAAEFLGLSFKTLEKWRSEGFGPPVVRLGRRVAYPRGALVTWVAEEEARGRKESALKNQETELVQVAAWPYKKDNKRFQVSIAFTHPLTDEPVRKRPVMKVPATHDAAIEWARELGNRFYRDALKQRGTQGDKDEKEESDDQEQSKSNHQPKTRGVMTLAEFWPEFKAGHMVDLKSRSKQYYEDLWSLHIEGVLGHLKLDEIDAEHLTALRKKMRNDKQLSATYARKAVDAACTMLRHAKGEGVLPKTFVMPELVWPKQPKVHKETYSHDELERFVACARHDEERLLYLLTVDGVLRIGECAGLMWKDINLGRQTMFITRNVCRGVLQDTAKGESGYVPLSPRLLNALASFPRRGPFVLPVEGAYSKYDGCRATRASRDYVYEGTLSRRVCRGQALAGLEVHGPHRNRHSILTLLAEWGVSPYALQALARHARMATTLQYYIHLKQAELARQAVLALSDPSLRRTDATWNPMLSGNGLANRGNAPEFVDPSKNSDDV